jgi:hypothetical protein
MENEAQGLKILMADLVELVGQVASETADLMQGQPNIQKGSYPAIVDKPNAIRQRAKLLRASADKLLPKQGH